MVALYWEGISIKAARANSVSFRFESTFFDIISVKFTNYTKPKLKTLTFLHNSKIQIWKANNIWSCKLDQTWKLSKARAGMLSSNSLIISHGPSPTPTKTIDSGYSLQFNEYKNPRYIDSILDERNRRRTYLAFTIASIVFFSCELSLPCCVSTLLVTCVKFSNFSRSCNCHHV
jgi:hypothetical protein